MLCVFFVGRWRQKVTVAVKAQEKFDANEEGGQGPDPAPQVRRELAILKDMTHPGVVDLLSWSESTFHLSLVFPCYDEDMVAFIRRGMFKLSPPAAVGDDILPGVCAQLLAAMQYLHDSCIVHRDIKPGNMLVKAKEEAKAAVGAKKKTAAVGAFVVAIADFGSAIRCDTKPGAVGAFSLVDGGQTCVGTYQFRAPEMFIKGPGCHCGYPSDVWALGVCIVEMDVIHPPFGAPKLMRSQVFQVFYEILTTLTTWKRPRDFDHNTIRKIPKDMFEFLGKLAPKTARELPWGKQRGSELQRFTLSFFLAAAI